MKYKKVDGLYICPGENGICRKDGTFFSHAVEVNVRIHYYKVHTVKGKEQSRIDQSKSRAKKSLVSNNTLKKDASLLDIEPFNVGDDQNMPSYEEFQPIYETRVALLIQSYRPYFASFIVAYFLPGHLDQGVMLTYDMACVVGDFTFYLYFGTHKTYGPCEYLNGKSVITDSSQLVRKIREYAFCYTQNFVFSGKTSEENKEDVLYFARFGKTVGEMKQRFKKDLSRPIFEVLNVGDRKKDEDQKELSPQDYDLARKHAAQNRSFLPFPYPHLLPMGPALDFVEYKFK